MNTNNLNDDDYEEFDAFKDHPELKTPEKKPNRLWALIKNIFFAIFSNIKLLFILGGSALVYFFIQFNKNVKSNRGEVKANSKQVKRNLREATKKLKELDNEANEIIKEIENDKELIKTHEENIKNVIEETIIEIENNRDKRDFSLEKTNQRMKQKLDAFRN